MLVNHGGEFSDPTWIWEHLAKEVDWLSSVNTATGELKDEL